MKREKLPKTIQIFTLDRHQKEEIKSKLKAALMNLGHDELDIDEYITNGMDGRLSDLEEIINIYELETIEIV